MPYIKFKFVSGDRVYIRKNADAVICSSPSYALQTVKTFFRLNNRNYYRLYNDKVFEENELLDINAYQALLNIDETRSHQCLENALLNLEGASS